MGTKTVEGPLGRTLEVLLMAGGEGGAGAAVLLPAPCAGAEALTGRGLGWV